MTLPEENNLSAENPSPDPQNEAAPASEANAAPSPDALPAPSEAAPDVEPAPQEDPPQPIRAEVFGPPALMPGPKSEPKAPAALPPGPAPKAPRQPAAPVRTWIGVSQRGLILAVLLGIMLSVALSLGILAIANQGLSYASRSDAVALNVQVEALQTQVDRQEADLNGLRARVDAVEKLAARTTTLEQAASTLQSELDKRSAELDNLRGLVGDAQQQIAKMVLQSGAFETFVAGLRGVLNQLPGFKP